MWNHNVLPHIHSMKEKVPNLKCSRILIKGHMFTLFFNIFQVYIKFATQNATFKSPPFQTLDRILDIKGKLSYHVPCLWICFIPHNNFRELILLTPWMKSTNCLDTGKLHMNLCLNTTASYKCRPINWFKLVLYGF